jgi:hypothetical protein
MCFPHHHSFIRPHMHMRAAGNALLKLKSKDKVKVVTVRTTSFEPAATQGGSATVEKISGSWDQTVSAFVGEELSKSDRPELTAAKTVVSGGALLCCLFCLFCELRSAARWGWPHVVVVVVDFLVPLAPKAARSKARRTLWTLCSSWPTR